MKQYIQLAVPLLIAAACTGGDQRSPTAPDFRLESARKTQSPGVQIVDLGALTGGWPSAATAINAERVIVGWSLTGANSGAQHAVRWQESTPGSGSWAIYDLSPLITGSTTSSISAINATSDVAGSMRNSDGDFAFSLTSGGTLTVIAPPAGMSATFATGINAGGAVVGWAMTNPDPDHTLARAFYYEGGTAIALPTLSGNSQAYGIRNEGTVVGYSRDAANVQHAVEWKRDASMNWTIMPLPASANARTEANEATAINNTGMIAGDGCPNLTSTGCPSGARAYLWPSDVSTPTLFGTLGGNVSAAYGVNDDGDIAGWSTTRLGVQRAFFSAAGSGVLTDLGSLARGNGSSTAAGLAGHLVVGQSETGSGRTPPLHAALWIVP
jgi:probable HAF family extracellular repeat protein